MPILVDTSVWVDFLRSGDRDLATCLADENVLMHSMVLGELSLGSIRNRTTVLTFLGDLPAIAPATDTQVREFVETHQLAGRGIGWVDAHLLTAVGQFDATQLWTRDKRLKGLAATLDLTAPLP